MRSDLADVQLFQKPKQGFAGTDSMGFVQCARAIGIPGADRIQDLAMVDIGLDRNRLYLLVHSGARCT